MFKILDDTENGIVRIDFVGQVGPADYQISVPEFEKIIETRKPLRLLFDWTRFSGWNEDADSQKFFMRTRHQGDFERIAIVGEHKWRSAVTEIDEILDAEVRLFDVGDAGKAMRWLRNNCGPP